MNEEQMAGTGGQKEEKLCSMLFALRFQELSIKLITNN